MYAGLVRDYKFPIEMRSCRAQLDGVVMVVMMQDTIPVRPPLAWAGNFINFGSELRVEGLQASLVR